MTTLADLINDKIADLKKHIENLERLTQVCETLGFSDDSNCTVYTEPCSTMPGIDFNNPTREEFTEIRKHFPQGTRWSKAPSLVEGHIDYFTEVEGFRFRAWSAPPPPSCVVTYETVTVPEHTERRAKLTCKGFETKLSDAVMEGEEA